MLVDRLLDSEDPAVDDVTRNSPKDPAAALRLLVTVQRYHPPPTGVIVEDVTVDVPMVPLARSKFA